MAHRPQGSVNRILLKMRHLAGNPPRQRVFSFTAALLLFAAKHLPGAVRGAGDPGLHPAVRAGMERTLQTAPARRPAGERPRWSSSCTATAATTIPTVSYMNATADRHGFAVSLPAGARKTDARQEFCWNVGYPSSGRHDRRRRAVPDRAWCAICREKHGLSRHNAFCTGMSERRRECYQLAAQRLALFAAVAPVSGLMLDWLLQSGPEYGAGSALRNPRHGGQDLGMAGRSAEQRRLGSLICPCRWPSHYWAAKNRCTVMQTGTRCRQKAPAAASDRAPLHGRRWGSEVWLYEIVGGKHAWGESRTSTRARNVWKFFSRFVK